jgi:hypothetical protein
MKNLLLLIWKWIKKPFIFLSKVTFDTFHSILLYIVLLIHAGVIFEFTTHKIEKVGTESLIAISYIIGMSVFWTFIFFKKNKEEKENFSINLRTALDENREYKEQLSVLDKYKNYVKAYKTISYAFSEIHRLHRFIKNSNPHTNEVENTVEIMVEHFGRFCDHIVTAYKGITGVDSISVCIKIIHGDPDSTGEGTLVKTLVRDLDTFDERDKDSGIFHPINANTAYLWVLKNIRKNELERAFFENNLPLLQGYQNSSKKIYGQEDYPDDMQNQERVTNWKLPYKSTIVAGIYPAASELKKPKHLIGYICIDSMETNIFKKEFDCVIFNGIADGLYNIIRDFKKFTKEASNFKKNKTIKNV